MVHIKIEDGRPINMNTHVCNCEVKCTDCKCKSEEDTRKAIVETIPSMLKEIVEKL